MSTLSNLERLTQLSLEISHEFDLVSSQFSSFQEKSKLSCISGCGRCCFKADIYCSPIEVLPMALDLLKKGLAQEFYDKCQEDNLEKCIFLDVKDANLFQGQCTNYSFRPLVCRTFGVSARHGKNARVDFSVCKPLKENRSGEYSEMISKEYKDTDDLPYIDSCKNRLIQLDPAFLEKEMPIHEALKIMLEKVLFYSDFSFQDSNT